jgi:hypothetical protein
VNVPKPSTIVEALTAAEKSVFVPPPGAVQRVAFAGVEEWRRARQVVSPAAAGEPVFPLWPPSFQGCKTRRRSNIESALAGGAFVTLIESVADMTVAFAGMFPVSSNLSKARLRAGAPLTPAVVPAASVGFAP